MVSVNQANYFTDDLLRSSGACLMHSPPATTQIWSEATKLNDDADRKEIRMTETSRELNNESNIKNNIAYTSACLPLYYTHPFFTESYLIK